MICIECKLAFSDGIEVCPQCNKKVVEDRRKKDRRKEKESVSFEDRRMSDRRKEFIKRFEEVFWKGNTKYC